jgi:putative FmdB family regulatory protein
MPTYEYRCKDCDHGFDAVQAFTDDSLTECPECGGRLKKVFGNVGITFKGSGFYKTDSRSAGSFGSAKDADRSDNGSSKKDSGSSDKGSSDKGSSSSSSDGKTPAKDSGSSKGSDSSKGSSSSSSSSSNSSSGSSSGSSKPAT